MPKPNNHLTPAQYRKKVSKLLKKIPAPDRQYAIEYCIDAPMIRSMDRKEPLKSLRQEVKAVRRVVKVGVRQAHEEQRKKLFNSRDYSVWNPNLAPPTSEEAMMGDWVGVGNGNYLTLRDLLEMGLTEAQIQFLCTVYPTYNRALLIEEHTGQNMSWMLPTHSTLEPRVHREFSRLGRNKYHVQTTQPPPRA